LEREGKGFLTANDSYAFERRMYAKSSANGSRRLAHEKCTSSKSGGDTKATVSTGHTSYRYRKKKKNRVP